jgi:tRNA-modifying protein YgfZ
MLHIVDQLKNGQDLLYRPKRGLLRMIGPDARAFLQRMSTGDVSKLTGNNPVASSFVNNKGRMVEHAIIFEIGLNDLALVTSFKDSTILYEWLSGFHFVEDFSFDRDYTANVGIIVGSPHHHENMSQHLCFWHARLLGLELEFSLVLGLEALKSAVTIDDGAWQALRIMALMPDFSNEINELYMPHNINLGQFIADNKGCYIGQEVIAKAQTYQKNVKTLCGASVSYDDWKTLTTGSLIKSVVGQVGKITSVSPSYVEHEANALVVVDLEQKDQSTVGDITITAQALMSKKTN